MTAHEARELLVRREMSSVELTRQVLARVEKLEPRLHSFLAVTADAALKQAEEADRRLGGDGPAPGPLTGIPVQLKDNISTAGVPTTAGSKILKG